MKSGTGTMSDPDPSAEQMENAMKYGVCRRCRAPRMPVFGEPSPGVFEHRLVCENGHLMGEEWDDDQSGLQPPEPGRREIVSADAWWTAVRPPRRVVMIELRTEPRYLVKVDGEIVMETQLRDEAIARVRYELEKEEKESEENDPKNTE